MNIIISFSINTHILRGWLTPLLSASAEVACDCCCCRSFDAIPPFALSLRRFLIDVRLCECAQIQTTENNTDRLLSSSITPLCVKSMRFASVEQNYIYISIFYWPMPFGCYPFGANSNVDNSNSNNTQQQQGTLLIFHFLSFFSVVFRTMIEDSVQPLSMGDSSVRLCGNFLRRINT